MKIICLGDSLTEGDYGVFGKRGIANVHERNYPYFLGKLLNAQVINYGKCGYTSSDYLKFYKDGNVDVSDADVIIVMIGTNGGMDDEEYTQGDRDFDELIELVKKASQNSRLFICTPPHVTIDENMSNCGYRKQVDKAVKFIKRYVQEKHIACIDLAGCEMFSDENEAILQSNDGLHFTEAGYAIMAIEIKNRLKQLL